MNEWSTDKIVGTGLIVALIISIVAGVWTGNGVELQTTIASGLIGFLGRVGIELMNNKDKEESKRSGEKVCEKSA